ncbi:alpha-ribazole phosphatase [Hyaloraphidium curvatum]|nr:alpha-ribazole phosphatase [Hyaloraphidium curvatum]
MPPRPGVPQLSRVLRPPASASRVMSSATLRAHRPREIILLRHGESEGNISPEAMEKVPDYRMPLTAAGRAQARAAGEEVGARVRPGERICLWCSPYERTRQTADAVLEALGEGGHHKVLRFEEPRLREMDWGNLQDAKQIRGIKEERAAFGHFFYRVPGGESGADCYDRISSFFETMFRAFERPNVRPDVAVIVTHGLMLRIFLMRFFHMRFEEFEHLANVPHCGPVVLARRDDGTYELTEDLETWGDLLPRKWRPKQRTFADESL